MGNEEFFNHQLRERIAREDAPATGGAAARRETAFRWPIGRLVWVGRDVAGDLFMVCAFFVMREKAANGSIAISLADFECAGGPGA